MTDETKAIADAALALPAVERAALTDQLLRSLDKPDEEIDAKWAAEAEVRIDAIDRGDMALHDADQVLKICVHLLNASEASPLGGGQD